MNFDYEKAYCVFAVPAFENLSHEAKNVHRQLIPLVGELKQNKLLIPISQEIRELITPLSTVEMAKLSRASYFLGHWKPSGVPSQFENGKGESWKISNCLDQILRERLNPPWNIEIHDGKFRVTFFNKDCWVWEEFSLATEENLDIFNNCNLPFGYSTVETSAEKLKNQINDLWPSPEDAKENDV